MDNTNQINKNNVNQVAVAGATTDIIFSGDDYGLYIFKRTEKVATAVFMLTALLSDNEPMKWSMRQVSNKLLSEVIKLSKRAWGQKDSFVDIMISFSELASLFSIANMAGMISPMNYEIMQAELEKMILGINRAVSDNSVDKSILAKSYFTDGVDSNNSSKDYFAPAGNIYKGQKDISDKHVLYKNSAQRTDSVEIHQKDKSSRQTTILALLAGGKVLTIKDFSSQIKDCSEKTIQRELLALVASKVLKKEGERRWSKYSLS